VTLPLLAVFGEAAAWADLKAMVAAALAMGTAHAANKLRGADGAGQQPCGRDGRALV
jgi:hypothetical protein